MIVKRDYAVFMLILLFASTSVWQLYMYPEGIIQIGLFIPLMASFFYVMTYVVGTYFAPVATQAVIFASGVVGRIIGTPQITGGSIKMRVSMDKSYTKNAHKVGYQSATGCAIIEVTYPRSHFIELQKPDCEASEGAIFCLGKTDGTIPEQSIIHQEIFRRMERYENKVMQMQLEAEAISAEMIAYAKKELLDLDESATYLKNMADKVKRITFIGRGATEGGALGTALESTGE